MTATDGQAGAQDKVVYEELVHVTVDGVSVPKTAGGGRSFYPSKVAAPELVVGSGVRVLIEWDSLEFDVTLAYEWSGEVSPNEGDEGSGSVGERGVVAPVCGAAAG